jgi:probable phosphoglycerate mutase
MKTRLIFVRHGEAEGNLKRLFHGWTDSELTLKGNQQAQAVAKRLKDEPIDIIYSSPLKRAYRTAQNIAEEKNISDIKVIDGLKEIHGGLWENVKWADLPVKWPVEYDEWENKPHLHCMPMGESIKDAFNRTLSIILKIIEENKGKNICVVTHGTVLRSLVCYFKGKPFEELATVPWCDNTSITVVEFDDQKFNVCLEGDNGHLCGDLSTFATQDWWKKEENDEGDQL